MWRSLLLLKWCEGGSVQSNILSKIAAYVIADIEKHSQLNSFPELSWSAVHVLSLSHPCDLQTVDHCSRINVRHSGQLHIS